MPLMFLPLLSMRSSFLLLLPLRSRFLLFLPGSCCQGPAANASPLPRLHLLLPATCCCSTCSTCRPLLYLRYPSAGQLLPAPEGPLPRPLLPESCLPVSTIVTDLLTIVYIYFISSQVYFVFVRTSYGFIPTSDMYATKCDDGRQLTSSVPPP